MSKIFNEFEKKKLENPDKLYLFKSGIFYIGLEEDAEANCSVDFEIVDLNFGKIESQEDYLNNQKVQEILKEIKNLDMNTVSYKEAFEILWKVNEELKK